MRKMILARVLTLFLATTALAAAAQAMQPGTAEGAMTVNGTTTELKYSYVLSGAKNPATEEATDVKVLLTDVPLPEDAKIEELGATFPPGVKGVAFQIDGNRQLSKLILQYDDGTYMVGAPPNSEHRLRIRTLDSSLAEGTISVGKQRLSVTYQLKSSFSFSFAPAPAPAP